MSDIHQMNADGTGVVNLTNSPGRYDHLSLSPDGRAFVYAGTGETFGLWTRNVDGSGLVQLTNRAGTDSDGANGFPRWSPDGSMIAFASTRGGRAVERYQGLYEVYVMGANGSDPRNVTLEFRDQLGFSVSVLGWTPAGQIVFETDAWPDGSVVERRIFVVRPDGSGMREVFDRPGDHSPFWSPDGSRIAFISNRDGEDRLYVMNADGSGARALSSHEGQDRLPLQNRGFSLQMFDFNPWSPDGRTIAFERFHDSQQHGWQDEWGSIYVVNVDGTDPQRVATGSSSFNSWSRDGTRIAFTRYYARSEYDHSVGGADIWAVNADGTELIQLTDSPEFNANALWLPHH